MLVYKIRVAPEHICKKKSSGGTDDIHQRLSQIHHRLTQGLPHFQCQYISPVSTNFLNHEMDIL